MSLGTERCPYCDQPRATTHPCPGAGSELFKDPRQYYPGLAESTRRAYRRVIDAARDAAKACGYCLTEHGSLARDIDLVVVPWVEDAYKQVVAEAIREAVAKANGGVCFQSADNMEPTARKPHGRLCWSLHLGGGPYIDLSVMPPTPPKEETP